MAGKPRSVHLPDEGQGLPPGQGELGRGGVAGPHQAGSSVQHRVFTRLKAIHGKPFPSGLILTELQFCSIFLAKITLMNWRMPFGLELE
jgi:hypothetical protein